ncbi:uncharacterized protein [Halyomorpha halys]|uniref:uncharacterized protein isoform X2 n=1 Tax=Halyomorpha halys TaxID=286706 RepID=UPI000D0C81FE|nr:uncharacterized protein LOC106680328 isoform X2 [Halyomorpha halys]
MGNKRHCKDLASDSLAEFHLHGISGGSGEHKLYSTDGFADDESYHPVPVVQRDAEPKLCFRCKAITETRSRCCRKCYQTRDQWMPPGPTRKLRKRKYSLVSSDEENIFPQPPLSKYSNLCHIRAAKNVREEHSSSEECSPWEFAEGTKQN